MITLYGIKNCDTVKKARKWLESQGIAYHFHDIRQDGLSADQVNQWIAQLGWESVLNRRSTTWRQLSDAEKEGIDAVKAAALILQHPTLLKRPLLDRDGRYLVGFREDDYRAVCG
jgi:arsenate reductase